MLHKLTIRSTLLARGSQGDHSCYGSRTDGESEEGEILLNSGLESSQLVTTDDLAVHDWIMDSGASFYVASHCEWFTSYDAKRTSRVCLGNDHACEIKGVGDVKLKFEHGSTFILKNV